MKLKIVAYEEKYIIYIYPYKEDLFDTKEKDSVENYFRTLFLKLKKYYQIEFSGYYDIHIYNNQNYGSIITVEKEEYEYYSYFDDKLDMRISFEPESEFLYELEDIYLDIKEENNFSIYIYNDHLYIKIENPISSIEMAKVLEHSKVIYGKEVCNILTFGKQI